MSTKADTDAKISFTSATWYSHEKGWPSCAKREVCLDLLGDATSVQNGSIVAALTRQEALETHNKLVNELDDQV